jgi:hypothetical protein
MVCRCEFYICVYAMFCFYLWKPFHCLKFQPRGRRPRMTPARGNASEHRTLCISLVFVTPSVRHYYSLRRNPDQETAHIRLSIFVNNDLQYGAHLVQPSYTHLYLFEHGLHRGLNWATVQGSPNSARCILWTTWIHTGLAVQLVCGPVCWRSIQIQVDIFWARLLRSGRIMNHVFQWEGVLRV